MFKRFASFFLCLFLIVSIGGVFATWKYAEVPAAAVEQSVGLSLSVFNYPPEEILPGGDMEEALLGENHFALIELILNERSKGYGLNYSDNTILHQYLERQTVVYSNQKVSGGNLKFILDPKSNTHGLYYCLEKVSETEIYAYTFSTEALATAGGSNVEIVVYRTTLAKTDQWRATTSYLGYAKTRSLRDLDVSADPNTITYSIDVSTWHY